jgi:ketosteroid isomerase-like protein
MSEEQVEIARRILEQFNDDGVDLDRGDDPSWAEDEAIDRDLEVVPLRAALEDTVYRTPDAADHFWSDCRASWRTLRFEIREIRDEDADHVLAFGTLEGTARETGLEVAADRVMLVTFRNGRVVRIATCDTEAKALEAIREANGGA